MRKTNFEKVYKDPLNWCPLFGYIPIPEKTAIAENNIALAMADKCFGIITTARLYLDVYDWNAAELAALPEIKNLNSTFKNCYEGRDAECRALRSLFQNLDYIVLQVSPNPIAVEICRSVKTDKNGIPTKPVGRTLNYNENLYSELFDSMWAAAYNGQNELLKKALALTDEAANLNHKRLFALYAILEAWLVMAFLLDSKPSELQHEALQAMEKRISYARELLSIASDFFQEETVIATRKRHSAVGGQNKSNGITIAAMAVKQETGHKTAMSIWSYLKNIHAGKSNARKCLNDGSTRRKYTWVCWRADKTGKYPDGILYEYDAKKEKILNQNTLGTFVKNHPQKIFK